MIWLLRLLALAAALFFLRWFFAWLWRQLAGGVSRAGSARAVHQGTLVRDPVCGMHVDAALAVRAEVNGEALHFCSERCRDAYLARPPEERARQAEEIRNTR